MTDQRHAALGLHPVEAASGEVLLKRQQVMRRTRYTAVVALLLLVAGAGRTLVSRAANDHALATAATENARQYVKVVQPRRAASGQTLLLPGTLQGQVQVPIAARASGYLVRWTHDIGSHVAKGTLLAEIASPEIDQQLSQAQAAREQAASALALARSTAERWEALRRKDVASQQELDEKRSSVAQAQANLAAAAANVERLRELAAFKRVLAPFAGVLTRRNVDVGDLIDPSRPLFTLAQSETLRLVVNVPQTWSALVHRGQSVAVMQAELRDRKFTGQVVRTAGAIDPATRTMQVEVSLPNPDGALLPGAYVQVSLPMPASTAWLLPGNTLLFGAEGTQVAVVDGEGHVALHKVAIGRNLGVEVEVLEGVREGERVVLNPPDWLAAGQSVVVVPSGAAASAASAPRAGQRAGA